jgi:hypothetical protein
MGGWRSLGTLTQHVLTLTMTIEERMERLTGIVETLPESVVKHDDQIEGLIKVAEKQSAQISAMQKQWEAYINTLPRH